MDAVMTDTLALWLRIAALVWVGSMLVAAVLSEAELIDDHQWFVLAMWVPLLPIAVLAAPLWGAHFLGVWVRNRRRG